MKCYVLERKGFYICKRDGVYNITGDINQAKKFLTSNEAGEVRNNLPHAFKNLKFRVQEIDIDSKNEEVELMLFERTQKELEKQDDAPEKNFSLISNHDLQIVEDFPMTLDEITEFTKTLITMAKAVKTWRGELQDRIKGCDESSLDMLHYIEFKDLNAREGFKTYKRLQDIRLERRRSKNTLAILDIFAELGIIDTERLDKRIDSIKNRKYKIRSSDNYDLQ